MLQFARSSSSSPATMRCAEAASCLARAQGQLVNDMRYLASVVTQCFSAFGELLALNKRFAELSGGVTRCARTDTHPAGCGMLFPMLLITTGTFFPNHPPLSDLADRTCRSLSIPILHAGKRYCPVALKTLNPYEESPVPACCF